MEEVRIDKYLWSIRVYKTRTDATDACKGGKVDLEGGGEGGQLNLVKAQLLPGGAEGGGGFA